MPEPILEIREVSKAFGATRALQGVSLSLCRGEIHALLGENGAGKSTLVKIISGNVEPDSGTMTLNGNPIRFSNPRQAMEQGIQVVYQELSVLNNLRVYENLSLGRTPLRRIGLGIIDKARARKEAAESLARLSYSLDLDLPVGELAQAERQIVEIARAIAADAAILLLDEPTSSLPPDERAKLYGLIRTVAGNGVAVVLITHNLEEAIEHADCITILRDGKVMSSTRESLNVEQIVEHMTGRKAGQTFPSRAQVHDVRPRLKFDRVEIEGTRKQISFDVKPGEIVGLAGLVGSGRSEILQAIFGMRRVNAGSIVIDGEPYVPTSPKSAIAHGIAYISADRQNDGLFPPLTVAENLAIARQYRDPTDRALVRQGIINHSQARNLASTLIERVGIKTESPESPITSLSGGNQQKVIIGRWLANQPKLLLADEPTRGVSIGSKVDIYRIIREASKEGLAFLVSSSEFEELVGLCDRILVVAHHEIVDSAEAASLTADALLEHVLRKSQRELRKATLEVQGA